MKLNKKQQVEQLTKRVNALKDKATLEIETLDFFSKEIDKLAEIMDSPTLGYDEKHAASVKLVALLHRIDLEDPELDSTQEELDECSRICEQMKALNKKKTK